MPTDLSFDMNPIEQRSPGLGRAFEDAVRHELRGARGPLRVRFSVWEGDGVRYVCKVEGVCRPSLEAPTPAWRWWSGLVATPDELADQLHEALAVRAAARRAEARERWGWAELPV